MEILRICIFMETTFYLYMTWNWYNKNLCSRCFSAVISVTRRPSGSLKGSFRFSFPLYSTWLITSASPLVGLLIMHEHKYFLSIILKGPKKITKHVPYWVCICTITFRVSRQWRIEKSWLVKTVTWLWGLLSNDIILIGFGSIFAKCYLSASRQIYIAIFNMYIQAIFSNKIFLLTWIILSYECPIVVLYIKKASHWKMVGSLIWKKYLNSVSSVWEVC